MRSSGSRFDSEGSPVMNRRHPLVLATLALAAALAAGARPSAAAGTITGTVKVTGAASSGDVIVFVQQAPGTFAPGKRVEMDQRKMQFIPHVLPIVAGTTVQFLNSDP